MFYLAPDECKRRIVKTEDDDPDIECAADGNNEKDNKEDANDPDTMTPGDAGSLDQVDTDPKDINEDTPIDTIIADNEGATMEKAPCAVQVPDDKPNAETADTYRFPATDIDNQFPVPNTENNGENTFSFTPTTDIDNQFPVPNTEINGFLFTPTTDFNNQLPVPNIMMEINGENTNTFAFPTFLQPDGFNQGFNFTEGTLAQGTHVNPYACDFGLPSDWSAFLAHTATPSLNPSMNFGFGDVAYNPSGLTQGAQLLYCIVLHR
jgi:hypothetical protein